MATMFIKAPAGFNPSELTGVIEADELNENHVNEVVEKPKKFLYLLR